MSKPTLGLQDLCKHVKNILTSGFVMYENPLSTVILANPERGKTTEVLRYMCKGIKIMNDCTAFGIAKYLNELKESDREAIHHIIVPDIERIHARAPNVRKELLATMQIFMAEGMSQIKTGFISLTFEKEPKIIGFIMATTPRDLGDRRSIFRRASFLSRVIPYSYEFDDMMKESVIEFVTLEKHLKPDLIRMDLDKKYNVIVPEIYKKKVIKYARNLADKTNDFTAKIYKIQDADGKTVMVKENLKELIGIRYTENFMCYLKSIALSYHEYTVTDKHFNEFDSLYKYFNYDYNEIRIEEK